MTPKKPGRRTHTCLQCGGSWESFMDLPTRCARCGIRSWTTRKPEVVKQLEGVFVLPERLPFGDPCWLFYSKGSASGGHSKIGGYIGVSQRADKMPKKVKIAAINKAWDGE